VAIFIAAPAGDAPDRLRGAVQQAGAELRRELGYRGLQRTADRLLFAVVGAERGALPQLAELRSQRPGGLH
jgi:hypothetical protein